MKKNLFILLGVLILSIGLLFSYIVKDNKENNKEISKVEKILSKPEGIQAYTLNGEKTNISYNDLIEGYEIDSITCKNGTIATYNKENNSVSLSNIHMPDYCTMDFKLGTYTITIDAGGGYFGNPTEIDDGYSDVVVLQKGVSVPVATGNTLNLTPNQKYMLSFDYWSDGGSVEFNVDLIPDSLPEIHPVATTTQQTMNWIFSSSSSDMNSSQIRYFNDRTVPNPQEIAIINKHLYKCDDCTLTYTKEVTKGNAYGSLNTPKRYGWDFLGWYLEDGTKVESTSINNIKGNHTITAKWSEHYYQVKLVGVNGTIEYAPIWYYRAGWENSSTKITANNGYTTNGATVSCTGSAGASISGDYLYLNNITEDQTCTVTFKKLTYNVTLSVVNGSGSTTKTVDHGSGVSFTGISPYSGYSSKNPTVSCTGGSLNGTTLTVSNVTSSRTCTISFKKNGPLLSGLIKSYSTSHTNGVYNENGYRYEGTDPNNYIYMTNKSTNEKELWRIIGLFNDGANGEEVIRVRRHYEKDSYPTMAYDSNSTNHFPNTTMYNSLSSTYNLTNYSHTVNFKMYLGTSSSSDSLTSSGWFTVERGNVPGASAKNNYNSSTLFIGSVGLIYPSDYGYAVLASNCPRTKKLSNYFDTEVCYNNNWLFHGSNQLQWLISPSASSANNAFVISLADVYIFNRINATSALAYSPVMSLDTGVMASGSGTKSDPYDITN